MARNHTLLAVAITLVVVAAPATAGAATAAGTQAAENQTDETGELAPGVYENGSVNTTALYQAHREGLLDEGYQTSESLDVVLNDSEFLTAETETAGTPDNENVSATTTFTVIGLDYDIGVWANESQKIVRIVRDDNTTYRVYRRGPPEFAGPSEDNGNETDGRYGPHGENGEYGPHMGDDRQGPHRGDGPHMNDGSYGPHDDGRQMNDGMGMQMGMGMHHGMGPGEMPVPGYAVLFLDKVTENFTVENETTIDDRTAYTLTAPVEIDDEAEGNFTGEVTLLVDETGVVHSADVSVDSDEYGSETEYSFTLEELGVDSVEQPDWVEDVPANATAYGPPEEQPGDGGYDDDDDDDEDENDDGY
ncbi:hypothetical protein ACFR9U_17330 [Halorientalis brevis]|uniref:Uncharacterized protein n=1 Tax=Halorientalis brevis TaxID=1126241 RepID=A0ABD6CFC4_9EURY|nr:hypothetical protein [Halorientalis brevis]